MVQLRWEDFEPASDDWCYRLARRVKEAEMTEMLGLDSAQAVRQSGGKYRSELAAMVAQAGFATLPQKNAILTCLLACDRLLSALPAELVPEPEVPDFAPEGQ